MDELRRQSQFGTPFNEVIVGGQVRAPGQYPLETGIRISDLIRAIGAVIASNQSEWFGRGGSTEIRPGYTVVVPLETDRIRPLTFWTSVTQILYQGAIAVAAVETFNN